jgi:hypothetical protein
MGAVDTLLSRLTKVRGRDGSWTACCPAHDDRGPSLSVKALDDGRILLHCFAGCGTDAVLGVVGLTMQDLMPPRLERVRLANHRLGKVREFTAADALRCLGRESALIAIVANDVARGVSVSPVDAERATLAAGRISECLEFTCGR